MKRPRTPMTSSNAEVSPPRPSGTEPPTPAGSRSPWELFDGRSGLALQLLAVLALVIGGVISVAARGMELDGKLIGLALAGLLLLAPLPMLAGDLMDALLLFAARHRRLSLEDYRRSSAVATPGAVMVVGIAVYPVVLAIGGVDMLAMFLLVAAFVLFGVLPVLTWLVRRVRGPGANGEGADADAVDGSPRA